MSQKSKLNILWTNADLITAEKMVFMYAVNAMRQNWWDEVTIIVWGATAKLVAENKGVQILINDAREEGIHISACRSCAGQLGVVDSLEALGLEVIYWGEPLTELIKADEKLITI